jgi:hypothetical protein
MNFKRDHPTNYWVRVLCLAFCMVFGALWLVGDAAGAATESLYNETNNYWADMNGNQKWTHTKDDYLVTAFCNDDGDLMVAYRQRGGSWNYSEVAAVDFLGNEAAYWQVAGVINTDNNSLVVMAGMTISTYQRVYAFTKFAASDWDDWDELLWMYQGSKSYYQGDLAINDTGVICGMTKRATDGLYYRLFDFDGYSMEGSLSGSLWDGVAAMDGFQVEANATGKFWIMWKDTDNKWYVRDLEKDLAVQVIHPDPKYHSQTFGFLDNGVCVVAGMYDYSTNDWPMFYYQETPETAFTAIRLDPITVRTWNKNIQIVITSGNSVPRILAYSETDEKLYMYSAVYDASEATWQGSRHDTGVESATEHFPLGASNSLWPQHVSTGINWTRGTAGWAITSKDSEENPDEWFLIFDGMNWTVDLTTADPEITTLALDDAQYDVYYSFALGKVNGTSPFGWTLLIGPGWMSLGALNGTLYGMPDGTGTEQIRVRLNDAVPRYDEVQWTLTIGTGSEGGEAGEDPASGICSSGWIAFCVIILILFVLVGVTADNML